MLVMLFLCNSLDSHPTIIFKPNGSFCRPTTLHFKFLSPFLFTKYTVWSEYYFVRIKRPAASTFKITTACNGWWRCWQATQVHCELLVAITVITQSLRKSRWDLDTDIRHPVLSRRRRFMSNNFSKQSTDHDTKFSLFNFALCIIQTAQSSCCAFLFFL